MTTVQASFDLDRHLEEIGQNGFTVVENFLDSVEVEKIREGVKDIPVLRYVPPSSRVPFHQLRPAQFGQD